MNIAQMTALFHEFRVLTTLCFSDMNDNLPIFSLISNSKYEFF